MTNDTFSFCQLLVSKRGELQAELVLAGRREEEVRQERRVLEKRCREANGEVLLLKNRLEVEVETRLHIQELQARTEGEVKRLQEQAEVAKEKGREFDTKLAQVTGREAAAQKELKSVRARLEMAQTHLAQLCGSEADAGSGGSSSEVASLTRELGLARNSQAEALASRDHVGRERDLGIQAGRLSKTREHLNKERKRLAVNLVQGVKNEKGKLRGKTQVGSTFKPGIFTTNDKKK